MTFSTRIVKILKDLTIPAVGEDVEQLKLPYINDDRINWYYLFRKLTVFSKVKDMPSLWSSNSTPGHTYNRNGCSCPPKGIYKTAQNSLIIVKLRTICNSKKIKTTQIPNNILSKYILVYSSNLV